MSKRARSKHANSRSGGVSSGDCADCRVSENRAVPSDTAPRRRFAEWQGPILIALIALVMLIWTWETWPDVLIDFGVERYIPWRLAEGDVLYRDISFHNGPLSQYFNSVCFRIFGSSLRTLVLCNLALLTVLIALMYYMLRQIGHRSAATAACVVFVLLFAFAQFVGIGNYNYVCPYAHEMTHGLLLSLAALVAAWPRGKQSMFLPALSGLALGLAFLTKTEVFLAGAAGTAAALLMGLWFERPGWRRALARVLCFLFAFLIPPVIAFLCLASAMSAQQAWLGTLGTWGVAVRSDILNLPFYRAIQGMDRPWENIMAMFSMTGLYAILLVPATVMGLMLRRPGQHRMVVATAVFGVTVCLFWNLRSAMWDGFARPMPLVILAMILAIGVCFWSHRREEAAQRRVVREISFLIFALALMAKMFLNAHIVHYGFVLAMPATLVLVVAAFDWAPVMIDRRGGFGWVFTAAATALLGVAASGYLSSQSYWISQKIYRVGSGGDAFWADGRGEYVRAAVEQITARSSAGTTLAVLPEGVMLNCLTGLRNPTSHVNFMPVELMLFDEERMVECFEAHPPDLIALVHKDTSEIGFQFFGRDYGRRLNEWISANYRSWCLVGAMPLQNDEFGILLLEKTGGRSAKQKSP